MGRSIQLQKLIAAEIRRLTDPAKYLGLSDGRPGTRGNGQVDARTNFCGWR